MSVNLKSLGLSGNEEKIYLFLLKSGASTTGPIIKHTGVANSRVYKSLNSLVEKGLVAYSVQKNGKVFQPVDPSIILENEKERFEKIKTMIPELKSLQGDSAGSVKTAVYEGFEGFKTAFRKIIDDCPRNGTIQILGFSEQQYASESLGTFLSNMNLKSAAKRQKLKIIMDSSAKSVFGKDRENEKFTDVRYMSKGYISPAAMDIFEDYLYIFLWEENPFVFMIQNKRIAESFKQYFEILWKMAKR